VVLVVESRVSDQAGAALQTTRDSFIILNLDPAYVDAARAQAGRQDYDLAGVTDLGKRAPRLTEAETRYRETIAVPADMGKRYGQASGDMNMVHTTAMAARLFGFRKPFIQGLCTTSYVLRSLARMGVTARSLDIRFARRVEVDTEIDVLVGADDFEVMGAGKLRAFGTWSGW